MIKRNTRYANIVYLFGFEMFLLFDDHESIHVHVSSGDQEAKFRVVPEIELIENNGLKPREIRQSIMAIEENREIIIERWNEYFENND